MKPRLKSASNVRQNPRLEFSGENLPVIRAKSATVSSRSHRLRKDESRFDDRLPIIPKININSDDFEYNFDEYRLKTVDVNLNGGFSSSRESDRDSQEDGIELLESIQDLEDEGLIYESRSKRTEIKLMTRTRSQFISPMFCNRCKYSVDIDDSSPSGLPIKLTWESENGSDALNKNILFRNPPSPIWHAEHAVQLQLPPLSPRVSSPDVAKLSPSPRSFYKCTTPESTTSIEDPHKPSAPSLNLILRPVSRYRKQI